MPQSAQPRNVGILIFPDVEILDFCGPFEVFASATLPAQTDGGAETRLFEVFTVAERSELVACRGGLLVQPNHTIDDHPPLDLVVVPGGYGTQREQENPVILDWIARQRRTGALTTSVCTGAFLLGAAGLLDGLRATTHWTTIDGLRTSLPTIDVLADARVVDEGEIITSAGVSAGIDMALHVVRRLHGDEVARRTARDMEYDGVLSDRSQSDRVIG
jgi:transcriptional regulator GlxA family with amidase domain